LTITLTNSSSSPSLPHCNFSKYAREANGAVQAALYPPASSASTIVLLGRGAVVLYSPIEAKMAVMSLSWEKSAYSLRPSGKVVLDVSRVVLVVVWSATGCEVRRAMSSFVKPTPWVGPRGLPWE
jgi:hypothetical protein